MLVDVMIPSLGTIGTTNGISATYVRCGSTSSLRLYLVLTKIRREVLAQEGSRSDIRLKK